MRERVLGELLIHEVYQYANWSAPMRKFGEKDCLQPLQPRESEDVFMQLELAFGVLDIHCLTISQFYFEQLCGLDEITDFLISVVDR